MGLLHILLNRNRRGHGDRPCDKDIPQDSNLQTDVNLLAGTMKTVFTSIDSVLGVKKQESITYGKAMKYFVSERPDDDRIVKGALLLRPAGFGESLLVWMFLDADEQPLANSRGKLYGRCLVVGAVDEELTGCFGEGDFLIVE